MTDFLRLLQEVSANTGGVDARAVLAAADLSGFSKEQLSILQDACSGSCALGEVKIPVAQNTTERKQND
jgi:hypothetical protein